MPRRRTRSAYFFRSRAKHPFIEPGKPAQKAFIESFNGRLWHECLNELWFLSLADARRTVEDWRIDYNSPFGTDVGFGAANGLKSYSAFGLTRPGRVLVNVT